MGNSSRHQNNGSFVVSWQGHYRRVIRLMTLPCMYNEKASFCLVVLSRHQTNWTNVPRMKHPHAFGTSKSKLWSSYLLHSPASVCPVSLKANKDVSNCVDSFSNTHKHYTASVHRIFRFSCNHGSFLRNYKTNWAKKSRNFAAWFVLVT